MLRKDYTLIDGKYTFKADDDWGDYYEGNYRKGTVHNKGYRCHWYNCTDGNRHKLYEHVVKWEFFNGKIPNGYEIDHIIPVSNGGTNKLDNLRCVTRKENLNNPNSFTNKSISHKGKKPWNKGKPWSDVTKKKIADTKPKIQVVQILNNDVVVFESTHEAERQTKIKRIDIIRCCNGGFFNKSRNKWVNVSQAGGSKWMYLDDYEKLLEDLASQQLN